MQDYVNQRDAARVSQQPAPRSLPALNMQGSGSLRLGNHQVMCPGVHGYSRKPSRCGRQSTSAVPDIHENQLSRCHSGFVIRGRPLDVQLTVPSTASASRYTSTSNSIAPIRHSSGAIERRICDKIRLAAARHSIPGPGNRGAPWLHLSVSRAWPLRCHGGLG